ncbi:MAG: hypothetical protein RLZZ584_1392 [Pseudomonadota bacterium]
MTTTAPTTVRPAARPTPAAQGPAAATRRWLIVLLLVLAGLGALRAALMLASGVGLQLDEAQYWHWSRDLHWGYYSKPPVIAALIAASTALFGHTVLGVKALAMACWLLVAVLVYLFTRDLVLSTLHDGERAGTPLALPGGQAGADLPERAGFWAALLFTTTPVAGLLGMAVTTDAPLLLCWTLASWLLWRALRSGRLSAWLLLGVVLGVGLLSKYTLAAWLPSAAVLAWLARLQLRRSRAVRLHEEDTRGARAHAGPSAFMATALPGGEASGVLGGAPQRRVRRLRCLPGLALAIGVALLVCLPHLAWNAAWGWPTWHHTADITAAARRDDDLGAGASLSEFIGGQLLLIGPVLAAWLGVIAAAWLGRMAGLLRQGGLAALARSLVEQASGATPTAGRAGGAAADEPAPGVAATGSPAPTLAAALAGARRHLLWLALPLLGLGAAQAINARAQMNWTAPVVPLLCIWLALHLVSAGSAAAAARRRRLAVAGMALSLGLTLFAAAAPSIAHALGRPWPARLDLYIRMRGWPEAYARLQPQLAAHPGWRVLGVNRTVIAHGAWLWRDADVDWAAWREPGPPRDHYQLTIPYDRARPGAGRPGGAAMAAGSAEAAEPLLVLSEAEGLPDQMRRRLADVQLLQVAEVQTAPGRVLKLMLWTARLPPAASARQP